MAVFRQLTKAPITEAIIDFEVNLPTNFDVKKLDGAHERIKDDYPIKEARQLFTGELAFKDGQIQTTGEDKGIHGYLFKEQEGKQVVQFRVDGFTFSKLKPYESWTQIFSEALRLWKIYIDVSSPESINRVAVRYINHLKIEIAQESISLADYLLAPPQLPQGESRIVSNFLTQLTMHEPDSRITTNFTQVSGTEFDERNATIILDIDSYKLFERLDPDDEASIRRTLEKLRKVKNSVFFGSITEKVVELYK